MKSSRGVDFRVAVVIPCYKVKHHIESVLAEIGPEVDHIICVDDCCPENSGDFIQSISDDPRVQIARHAENRGVGGAVLTGYTLAIDSGADLIVKIDGDGQMDPALLPAFVTPIVEGHADYTKGNRFWDLRQIRQMPYVRRLGNLGLSFLSKISTGYWDVFDPTNGYTAIHASVAQRLPIESISQRYFFETDMLFRLNTMRATVVDIAMDARYGDETSNLSVRNVLFEFAGKHAVNFLKRIAYNYYLRDLSAASLELLLGASLLLFGLSFGGYHWYISGHEVQPTPLGTVMIATVAVVSGLQFLLAFVNFDVATVPKRAIYPSFNLARLKT